MSFSFRFLIPIGTIASILLVAGIVATVRAILDRIREGPGRRGKIDEDPEYLASLEVAMKVAMVREKEMEEEDRRTRELEEAERRGERIYHVIEEV